jgi:hypothetical protein
MNFAVFVSLVALAAGFFLGLALSRWAEAATPPSPPSIPPGAHVLERYRAQARELAERAVVAGAQVALGAPLAPTGIERHLEKGARPIALTGNAIAALAGAAFMEGVVGLRRALGVRSGIDDGVLDEAVAAALEEVDP